MKHRRTTRTKKYKSNMLDSDIKYWTYGGRIAREATLRKEYKQHKKSKHWDDEI